MSSCCYLDCKYVEKLHIFLFEVVTVFHNLPLENDTSGMSLMSAVMMVSPRYIEKHANSMLNAHFVFSLKEWYNIWGNAKIRFLIESLIRRSIPLMSVC